MLQNTSLPMPTVHVRPAKRLHTPCHVFEQTKAYLEAYWLHQLPIWLALVGMPSPPQLQGEDNGTLGALQVHRMVMCLQDPVAMLTFRVICESADRLGLHRESDFACCEISVSSLGQEPHSDALMVECHIGEHAPYWCDCFHSCLHHHCCFC